MADHTPSTNDSHLFQRHNQLLDWIRANNGYFHPDARIVHNPAKGYHVTVAEGKVINAGTWITRTQIWCTLSVLNVLDIAPFASRGTKFPKSFLDNNVGRPELLQTFYLMEQYLLGDRSWWVTYIKTLPSVEDVNALQFEDVEDRAWIEGTNLKTGYAKLVAKWQDLYTSGRNELTALGWQNAVDDAYSWELYRWAATMFGSRSFTSEVLSDTTPADQARLAGSHGIEHVPYVKQLFTDRFSVLLPLLDILNHRPGSKVEWRPRSSFVGLKILEEYQAGEELTNNYGPRDNESLLLSYGFVVENNPFEHVLLALGTPPGSPLAMTRSWPKDPRSNNDFRPFLLAVGHYREKASTCLEASVFSYDLLDSVSVLSANDRELQNMFSSQRTLMSSGLAKPPKLQDFRNLLSTFGQLLLNCQAGAARLLSTYPTFPPQSPKQQNIKIYRDSQYEIYATAIAACKYILLRACTESYTSSDESRLRQTLQSHLEESAISTNLSTLLSRHRPITKSFELLPFSALVAMLPESISSALESTTASLVLQLHSLHPEGDFNLALSKSRLALFLSAAYHSYSRGVRIPSRLRLLMEELSSWYPPDDPNWSYVPTPGPWEPGEEPPPALIALLKAREISINGHSVVNGDVESNDDAADKVDAAVTQWLKPRCLCWGWNVMEEEGVAVPREVLQVAGIEEAAAARGHSGPMDFLMYVRQY